MTADGSAFGLDVRSELELPGVAVAPPGGGRAVTVRAESPEAVRAGIRESVLDEPPIAVGATGDGALVFDHPYYGSLRIAGDGRDIACAPGDREPWLWQRFLVAQALPAAALLQGLQPMHASAVAVDGRGVLVVGTSGAGKTTTALGLVRHGATFVCDDVAALAEQGGDVNVAPGSGLLSVDERRSAWLVALGWRRLGSIEDEGRWASDHVADEPVPVRLVVVLTREEGRHDIEASEAGVDWAGALLGTHFAPWLARARGRELDWVACCQALASPRVERVWVRAPIEASEEQVAEQVLRRMAR